MSFDPITELARLQGGARLYEALALFDSLPAVTVEQMMGRWRGADIPTGNPFDGLLAGMGWHGKRFTGPDDAHPLVFANERGQFLVNPKLIPLDLAIKLHKLLRKPTVQRLSRPLLSLMRTNKPAARLRLMEYRGIVTATMSYDALAINDHFRLADDSTLLGAMDLRGLATPFFFTLRKES